LNLDLAQLAHKSGVSLEEAGELRQKLLRIRTREASGRT